eukprot:scaffold26523_cov63-Phaeocystis_antarctica.AAC.3
MTPFSALLAPAHVRLCLSARCPLSTEEVAGIAPSPQGALLRGRRDYAGCRARGASRSRFCFIFRSTMLSRLFLPAALSSWLPAHCPLLPLWTSCGRETRGLGGPVGGSKSAVSRRKRTTDC